MDFETGNDRISFALGENGHVPTTGLRTSTAGPLPKDTPAQNRATGSSGVNRGDYHAIQLPTLVHYCLHYAQSQTADQPAFTHVTDTPGNHQRLSFAELDHRARAIAAEIQERGGAGHPVLVVQDPGVDYAASLFGCLYAGAIAVPVYPPQMLRLQQTLPRLQAMVANAGAKCMISTRDLIGNQVLPMWQMPHSMAIAVDEIDLEAASRWDGALPKPDDIAVLQYTSGSTGNPRGVVLPHRVLLSNLNAVIEHYHFEGANSVQWVPPYHDMGLIGGIFVPIFRGVEAVVISPVDFVRNPLLWLQCIDHYRGTSNGSPNFGYDLCVRRIKETDCDAVELDLSSWKVAIAGAEPVRANTLRRFTEKFAPYGFAPETFCPAFGMAETTVFATGTPLGQPYRSITVDSAKLQTGELELIDSSVTDPNVHPPSATQELVSSGVAVESMAFEIVDPQSCRRVPDGAIGEIWFRGASVARGYWNDPEATAKTFDARIQDDPENEAHRFLRTGDLGSRLDGELFVTGRLKELIIVGGRNLYPHDVEEVVQSISESFRPDTGTAFSIDAGDREELVVVQELWRPKKFNAHELLPEIVAALAETMQVTPHAVVLVRSGTLPKTSSGKLRRNDTKNWFLQGKLNEWARWQSGGEVTETEQAFEAPQTPTEICVAEIWSELLQADPIGRQDNFFHLGGGSLLVAQMLTELAERLDIRVGMTTLFRYPQLSSFAAEVDSQPASELDHDSSVKNQLALSASAANRTDLDGLYPLSDAQKRFWLLDQLGKTNAFVYVPVSIQLGGNIDLPRLQSAIDALVARHPMLRSRVVERDGDVFQFVDPDAKAPGIAIDPASASYESLIDVGRSPMFHVSLHQGDDGTSRLDWLFHHMVCDATSVEILLKDLNEFYRDGVTSETSDDSIDYVDYAVWDQSDDHHATLTAAKDYWQERLAGMPTELNLPKREAADESGTASVVSHAWKTPVQSEVSVRLTEIATKHGVTVSMLYLTVFETLLARYGDSDDFAITVPTSNRPASGLNRTVGCFVNPVMYRATVDPNRTWIEAIETTRDRLLADLDHALVAVDRVIASTAVTRNAERMPLSQVMFLYQPPMGACDRLGDVPVRSIDADYSAVTAYDLSLVVQPGDEVNASTVSLIAGESMDLGVAHDFFESFQVALGRIATSPDDPRLAELLPDPPRTNAVVELAGSVGSSRFQSVIDRVGQHATATPDRVAIADDRGSITYQQLDEQSDRFAEALRQRGAEPGGLVAVDLPRSHALLVAIVGIWKAACAYVPLDASLPPERRRQIIEDAKPMMVVDQPAYNQFLSEGSSQSSLRSTDGDGVGDDDRIGRLNPDDLAYVMYTSGSTGKPKGVAVQHGNVANLLASFATLPGFDESDCMLAVTTVTFDISVLEMMLPLWSGGLVRITAHRISDAPEAVAEVIDRSRPTYIQSTPSAFRMLLSTGWKPRRDVTLLCGGEPLMPDLAGELLATNDHLWNVYGPTETTVWSTVRKIESSDEITIGRPIANTTTRILDRNGLDVPRGVVGELLIGGHGVARGYFKDENQTNERFVEIGDERFYRTGDQVRMRTEGNREGNLSGELEFLARNDRQVKIRGFRVELDEIESALQRCDSINRAAVVVRRGSQGIERLDAYCAVDRESLRSFQTDDLRRQLSRLLPDYMIPSAIEIVPELPQTPAGKTDYRALPDLGVPIVSVASEPPQTPIERTLAEAWCEILERDTVGRHDHFFDLGGNSLMAAQLFARLRQRFEVDLRLSEIFQRPTIATLAEAIVRNQSQAWSDNMEDLLSQLDSLSEDEALKALEQDS
ncbi:non-ribosomal peptide synthetase [Neorhodopirellula pilleata]|uniref:Polyketide synthase PksJ n=1 Tax=Neorhodopirellula pilleata TaxID=2714738 RepID=A0A5C6B029_9BACT|nr:non-ribosomal peptide synthetase [Neorhodopirellula pilleata]TWU03764.1 Polyketide synthase PksJ [Neorhodopirellula pilleata]